MVERKVLLAILTDGYQHAEGEPINTVSYGEIPTIYRIYTLIRSGISRARLRQQSGLNQWDLDRVINILLSLELIEAHYDPHQRGPKVPYHYGAYPQSDMTDEDQAIMLNQIKGIDTPVVRIDPPTLMPKHDKQDKILLLIKASKAAGLSRFEIQKKCQTIPREERDEILDKLLVEGKIIYFRQVGRGRPTTRYRAV